VEFDRELFDFYRRAIELRTSSSALRRGELHFLDADDSTRFLAFRREAGEERLVIGLNRGEAPHRWEIPIEKGEMVSPLFAAWASSNELEVEHQVDRALVTVPALDGVVLRISQRK
jgi:hypothetical protein